MTGERKKKKLKEPNRFMISARNYYRVLHTCIIQNDLRQATAVVNKLPHDMRHQIVKPMPGVSRSLIFTAIDANNIAFIRLLVKECNADLEVTTDGLFHRLTALGYAIMNFRLEVVMELVQLGANVNSVSPTMEMTALHYSCMVGHFKITEHLLQQGTDPKKVDRAGITPLMVAADKKDIATCRLLLKYGADVNAQKQSGGDTALHLIPIFDNFELTKLLLEHGADPLIRNNSGDTAIRTACVYRSVAFVNAICESDSVDVRTCIASRQLLGAYFLDDDEITDALEEWTKAVSLHIENPDITNVDEVTAQPHPVFGNTEEANTLAKLDRIRQDENLRIIQGLYLKEKILGQAHSETISSFIYYGKMYNRNLDYSRGLRLLAYGFELSRCHWTKHRKGFQYIDFLRRMCSQFADDIKNQLPVRSRPHFQDVYDFLKSVAQRAKSLCVAGLKESQILGAASTYETEQWENEEEITRLMHIAAYLIRLFCCLETSADQRFQFKKLVYNILRLNLKTSGGRTLLMVSICESDFVPLSLNTDVIKLLLECGADTRDRDENGNTALNLLGKISWHGLDTCNNTFPVMDMNVLSDVGKMLFAAGAHFDATNTKGSSNSEYLETLGFNSLKHVTLACLAARVIRRHSISYAGILSKPLADFVELH